MAESAPESWTDTERALWAAFREGEVFDPVAVGWNSV